MKKYILNTPVLTGFGLFRFSKISIDEAKELAANAISAVGHQGAAEVLSNILGMEIKVNRAEILMEPGDIAVVFRIKRRLPEGAVLDAEETLRLPYDLGKLERIE
ncbi:MAG: YddF family protein [Deltaproteobacteria bacterium]|nr:YddF family protein [Deltaproteobacteria bacterium]